MTNPVILLGTQSNGETLPVQVDATGRLVAEGLQGEKGEQGEQGIQGPPGPASEPEWPPNPQEDQVITYKNGEVVWAASSGGASFPTSFLPFLHNVEGWIQNPEFAFETIGCDSARTGSSGGYWGLYPPSDMVLLSVEIMAGKRDKTIEYRLGRGGDWLGTKSYPSCDSVGPDNAWVSLNRLAGLEWRMDNPIAYRTLGGSEQSFFKRVRINGLEWVNGGLQHIKMYESIRWNLYKSGVPKEELLDNDRLFNITSTSVF